MSAGERGAATRLPVRKEDVSRLTPELYGRAEIARMLDAADPEPLLAAAAGWDAAAGQLATLHDDLRARAESLAVDWDGAAAAACQFALRRIAGTARQLSRYAEDLRSALSAVAQAQQRAKQQLAAFRARPTVLGGIEVGGSGTRLLEDDAEPGLAEQLDQTARQWMRALYGEYRSAMEVLPDEVAFDLPGLIVPDLPGQVGPQQPGADRPPPSGPDRRGPDQHGPAAVDQPGPSDAGRVGLDQRTPIGAGQPGAVSDGWDGTATPVVGPYAGPDRGAGDPLAAEPSQGAPVPHADPAPAGAAYGGTVYGGTAEGAGTVLAGGIAAAPLPLDPRQPDGGGWQGTGSDPAATNTAGSPAGPPGAAGAAGVAGVGPPPGQPGPAATDAGSVVGAIADALGGADQHQHSAGPAPGAVPGVQAHVPPAVDAPYVAATVADAVAAAQQHDPATGPAGAPDMAGSQGERDQPAPQSAMPPDATPAGADIPDAKPTEADIPDAADPQR